MDTGTAAPGHGGAAGDELSWLPAWKIRDLIVRRELSPVEVTGHFLARIAAIDPRYHAFRMIDPDAALDQARAAERAVLAGEAPGPLHGIPVAVKEHVPVRGLHWHDLASNQPSIAERDGIEAERLRRAGAILVGTTVAGLTAVEFGSSDRQPLNPWSRERICGDSSSGSACAAATAMTPLGIAVDGLGSTRLPAAYCGLVGLMATRGRVPSITSWSDLSSRPLSRVGPLARDVRDAATILSVLAGPDGRDLFCLPDAPPDYLRDLDAGVDGMRLVWTDDFGFGAAYAAPESGEIIATVRRAAEALAGQGAGIRPATGSLEDPTGACNEALVSDPGVFIHVKRPADVLAGVREMRARVMHGLEALLDGSDFIICPTAQQIAPTLQQWADYWQPAADGQPSGHMSTYTTLTGFVNLIGWPAMCLPADFVNGMPVSLQIIGRPNSEPAMLRLAQAFQQSYRMPAPSLPA
jgi:Asp-tRNA(Asn)/Glu-tRNA(Gln) amidotransferase A subunit family amidase